MKALLAVLRAALFLDSMDVVIEVLGRRARISAPGRTPASKPAWAARAGPIA